MCTRYVSFSYMYQEQHIHRQVPLQCTHNQVERVQVHTKILACRLLVLVLVFFGYCDIVQYLSQSLSEVGAWRVFSEAPRAAQSQIKQVCAQITAQPLLIYVYRVLRKRRSRERERERGEKKSTLLPFAIRHTTCTKLFSVAAPQRPQQSGHFLFAVAR